MMQNPLETYLEKMVTDSVMKDIDEGVQVVSELLKQCTFLAEHYKVATTSIMLCFSGAGLDFKLLFKSECWNNAWTDSYQNIS